MKNALQILAGPTALSILRERGLNAADVDVVAGASGGPKWLVLSGLDRVVFAALSAVERDRPLHLIGSSIGSWRMACLAQRDPVAAVERLEQAYIEQRYSPKPSPSEVTGVGMHMLDRVLGRNGAREILENPDVHLHVVAARCSGLAASERRRAQLAGLTLAALANAVSRKTLCWQMERVIFDSAGDTSPFRTLADLPTRHVALTDENLRPALLASGSIPLVLEGVRVPGAPAGMYRDGGMTDYHLDIDYGDSPGLVLYPHFYSHITPGWFDKSLPWRKAGARNFDRAVLLAPSDEFVTGLPGGKLPDRRDFHRYQPEERMRIWQAVCDAGRQLGDEFAELMENGHWLERAKPFPA